MSHPPSGRSPEDERPLPELPFFRQVAGDLWDGYFTLIVWSLILWVLSVPGMLAGALTPPLGVLVSAFTIAPALAGLMVACGKAAQGGFARVGDAARGSLRLYWRSVLLALPLAILLSLVLLTADMINQFPDRLDMVMAWALQMGFGLAAAILHIYLLPVLALYDTPLKKTVQLAMVLVGRCVWQTLALMILGVVLLSLTMLHPLVWLIVPGVWCVVVMNFTWRTTRPGPGVPVDK